jgi:hypothetical protein
MKACQGKAFKAKRFLNKLVKFGEVHIWVIPNMVLPIFYPKLGEESEILRKMKPTAVSEWMEIAKSHNLALLLAETKKSRDQQGRMFG